MAPFALATIERDGRPQAMLVVDGHLYPLPDRNLTVSDLLEDWDRWFDHLDRYVDEGSAVARSPVDAANFLPPVPRPTNLYMVGANYLDHLREMQGDPSLEPPKSDSGPFIFLKPTTTVVGHRRPVVLPRPSRQVDWEVELGVVMGRQAHAVTPADALDHVAGYTVLNDVSARDIWVRSDMMPMLAYDWLLQKGWETFCPMGPSLVPAAYVSDPQDLALELHVGDEVPQRSSTDQMIYSVAEQIAHISRVVPLVPGDVIGTGTCAGVGAAQGWFLRPGDEMTARIAEIGTLCNPVTGP